MHSLLLPNFLLAVLVWCLPFIAAGAEQPLVAAGYAAQIVTDKVAGARGIIFDTKGHLLVLLSASGLVSLDIKDSGGTNLTVTRTRTVINDTSLNHGLQISPDGTTLYASSPNQVFSWKYDPDNASVSQKTTVVTNMTGSGHSTRTLLLTQNPVGNLLVSHGSDGNLDPLALDETTGHSQIRSFNLSSIPSGGYNYNTQGIRVGWGLRNSVGVGEHPITAGIYSVENSADQIQREGKDVSRDNPAEEMNYHGLLNSSSIGANYGYPTCFTAWSVNDIPDKGNLTVGAQFVLNTPNTTINDTYCARERRSPRLAFQAHQAPLDIKFNNSGNEAWVTFHGSWDRTDPVGYKLSMIPFANGEPIARSDNTTAAIDIVSNPDLSKCPDSCFRPVGLAFDSQGRLFMSSDSTGEIYVVAKQKASETSGTSPSGTFNGPTPSRSGSASLLSGPSFAGMIGLVGAAVILSRT